MISIINYGLGNVLAFYNIYKKLNIESQVVSNLSELESATKIILPGVGSFDWAMDKLNKSGMRETLDHLVLEKNIPVMGICVGMQMMANSSEEGQKEGLGWFNAKVKKIKSDKKIDLPHMGWNEINIKNDNTLFQGLQNNARFYFLHSYYFETNEDECILCETNYGGLFTSAAKKNNIFAIQFHPEKSHQWGECILKNFSKLNNA
jgi:glutamine amidotransferase